MAVANDDRLQLLIERIERLEEEKKNIGDDIKDVYGEAKATGYDAKIMRQIVRLRKMKPDDRWEYEAVLDTYKAALGMDGLSGTPLGQFEADLAADLAEANALADAGGRPAVETEADWQKVVAANERAAKIAERKKTKATA